MISFARYGVAPSRRELAAIPRVIHLNDDRKLPVYAEIANLEHRLAFLRERQANITKIGKAAGYYLMAILTAPPVAMIYALATGFGDPLIVLFLLFLYVTIIGLTWWLGLNTDPKIWGVKNPYFSFPDYVEHAIAKCERRLAELKGQR